MKIQCLISQPSRCVGLLCNLSKTCDCTILPCYWSVTVGWCIADYGTKGMIDGGTWVCGMRDEIATALYVYVRLLTISCLFLPYPCLTDSIKLQSHGVRYCNGRTEQAERYQPQRAVQRMLLPLQSLLRFRRICTCIRPATKSWGPNQQKC